MVFKFNPFTGNLDDIGTNPFGTFLALSGGTLTGPLEINIPSVSGLKIYASGGSAEFLTADTNNQVLYNYGNNYTYGYFYCFSGTDTIFNVDPYNRAVNLFVGAHFYDHIHAEDDPMYIKDSDDNPIVAFDKTSSAVNYLGIANASAGNGPELNATGTDDNIDVEINPKGSGGCAISGSGTSTFQESIVINAGGYDQDSRCEGDTDPNVWYVDAGNNRLGVGTSSPTEKLTVSGNAIVHGEFKGARTILQFNRTSITADAFLGAAAAVFSGSVGYCMPRDGCVVDVSASTSVTSLAVAGSIVIEARINGVKSFSGLVVVPSTGTYNWYATTTRGTVPFSAGSPIVAYIDYVGFSGTCAPIAGTIGIQQDT